MDTSKCYLVGDNKMVVIWQGKDHPEVQQATSLNDALCARLLTFVASKHANLEKLAAYLVDQHKARFLEASCTIVRTKQSWIDGLEITKLHRTIIQPTLNRLDSSTVVFGLLCEACNSESLFQEYQQVVNNLKGLLDFDEGELVSKL